MNVDEALEQIDALKGLADRNVTFGGFRAIPVLSGGLLALLVAVCHPLTGGSLHQTPSNFVLTWTYVAVLCVSLVLADMGLRYLNPATAQRRRLTSLVMLRLAPCLTAGAALTIVVLTRHPSAAWILPSLWSLLLGLGIFATADMLPTSLRRIGHWYVVAGLTWLIAAEPAQALSPTYMGLCFGGGQCWTAWILSQQR